ncbi:hypothetical protein SAMN04488589_2065 [Methanolobus vulcani]|jgi:hypothetical protein|uniref:Uncharacterized protein n=1 Tax=Methanolobus vulcani TaxID=38026 RepID=A0A7Z7FD06_9EURY|nr:hypothetical protein [Methanolobus vulcani]MDK2826352.1 hypothetical protein [Methanolobus sp.]SDG05718.1 hypothetical protein SAMN04488589_2065 [Methanolobus vulcani]
MRDTWMTIVGPILLLFAMFRALLQVLLPELPINNNKEALKGGYE